MPARYFVIVGLSREHVPRAHVAAIAVRHEPVGDQPAYHDWFCVAGRAQRHHHAPGAPRELWRARAVLAQPTPSAVRQNDTTASPL